MSKVILPEPTEELKELSRQLCACIREELATSGFMPFSRFMEMALYQPGLGYYSAGLHKLGAAGDFVTAAELGSLFAACLAKQVEQIGQKLGRYNILELGAGSGRMAIDLLQQIDPERSPQRYFILERSADLRAVQQQQLAAAVPHWRDRVHWLNQPPTEDWQGVLLANEVIDALAVERFRLGSGEIKQMGVRLANGDSYENPLFEWAYRSAPDYLTFEVEQLQLDCSRPYQSEIQPELASWLATVSAKLKRGVALFVDYGYPRREYYLPERTDGTLICNYRHRAHDGVFFWPGLQDISAFVDFTALAEAGEACGLELSGYTSQTLFLLGCGLDQLLTSRMDAATDHGLSLQAEAKQLTLPGMMGERFQVMALKRDLDEALRGFALGDLSYRL
ncbi:MAG: SAM-dependent methyltransferase [Xanthomonadales bacterium]|nr:SAM-dependent methyltransferase [Xanthomonadales bacterium]